jgi:hypothetical protein
VCGGIICGGGGPLLQDVTTHMLNKYQYPRAGTAGINSGSSSGAHYYESEDRLFSLILCKSGFHALLRCKPSSLCCVDVIRFQMSP